MGLFKKFKSALGGRENTSKNSSALDQIDELKRQMGKNLNRDEEDNDQKIQELSQQIDEDLRRDDEERERNIDDVLGGIEESLKRDEDEYETDDEENEEDLEDEDFDEDEEEEEDEELVENRAKPIFVVRLKRFGYPLTPVSVREHSDEFAGSDIHCVLMRDNDDEPDQANCFFDAPVDKLLNKAVETLEEWNEDEETEVEPVVDIVTEIKCYNDDIDKETLKKVCYFIVNDYGEQAMDVRGRFPYKESLVRIIRDDEGFETVKDVLAYPILVSLDEDDEGWVERMISEHGIKL